MARPKTKKERAERRLDQDFEKALSRDYRKYLEEYYNSPNEKKGERMTKDEFARNFAGWYQKAESQSSTGKVKNLREHKIGEHIFEFETSAFSEKELKNLTSAIDRARAEISSREFSFDGDASDIAAFMAQTDNLDEDYIRGHYSSLYMLLHGLFASREEFEAWISPEVSATSI